MNSYLFHLNQYWNEKDKDFLIVVKKAIKSISEHIHLEHQNYLKIVNKVTENSNIAIRNAIQNGQHDCLQSINKIQEKFDSEKDKYIKAQKLKFDDFEDQIHQLKREKDNLQNDKNDLLDKLIKSNQEKNDAVDKALIEQK